MEEGKMTRDKLFYLVFFVLTLGSENLYFPLINFIYYKYVQRNWEFVLSEIL